MVLLGADDGHALTGDIQGTIGIDLRANNRRCLAGIEIDVTRG